MSTLVKKLSGHSGCQVSLIKIDDTYAVKKISGSKDYNERLRLQCAKQTASLKGGIYAPKVYKTYTEDGLFAFEMEYIEGRTLSEYMPAVPASEIPDFISSLFKALHHGFNTPNPKASEIFKAKIFSLEYLISKHTNLNEAFAILGGFDWSTVYESPCHGDLTLENILITPDKKLYLIDFLDSFYNSWILDIAKILQDLDVKWSYRNKPFDKNRDIKLFSVKKILLEKIRDTENGADTVKSAYHILLLNLLRVYPYLKDEHTKNFLDKSVDELINTIKKGV